MDATTSTLETMLPKLEWSYDKRTGSPMATLKFDAITIIVRREPDYDSLSFIEEYLGKGIDKPEDGCIKRRHVGWREYSYFMPVYTAEEQYRDLATNGEISIEEAMRLASEYVMQNWQRWEDYNNNCWSYEDISAEVRYKGYELAKQYCGGVESDSGDDHFLTLAWEVIHDVLDEAIEALADFASPPIHILEMLDAQISDAFKAAREINEAARETRVWVEPIKRDPKDIPPYVPQHSREWRRIFCPLCVDEGYGLNDITDEEDRYTVPDTKHNLRDTRLVMCRDCYEVLFRLAEEQLITEDQERRSKESPAIFINISVKDVEDRMGILYWDRLQLPEGVTTDDDE